MSLDKIVADLETTIWSIVHRTFMHVCSLGEAERSICNLLDVRAQLLEQHERPNVRKWEAENYPEVPGPVRCIAEAVKVRHPVHEREYYFKVEMTRMLGELEGMTPPEKLQAILDAGPPTVLSPDPSPERFDRARYWREVADFAEMVSAFPDDIYACAQFIEETGLGWEEFARRERE